MKSVLIALLFIFQINIVSAQAPEKINYQGIARDASGNPFISQSLDFRFSFLSGSPNGNIVYQEEFINTLTNGFGLFNLQLGSGSPLQGIFNSISWGSFDYFLQVEMKPSISGAGYGNLGTSQLISVPYALYAKDVQNKDDADADPGNEIQFLSISGDSLKLSNGGNVVLLEADHDWIKIGNRVFNLLDSIGIGTAQPKSEIDINGQLRYSDGNEADGKVLTSDGQGFASWTSLDGPYSFRCTNANWGAWGPDTVENIYCDTTFVLTKRSLVTVHAHGHASISQTPNNVIVGIVFSGESLSSTSPRVYADLKEAPLGTVLSIGTWIPIGTSRSKILLPGTHNISLRFRGDLITGNTVFLSGASISTIVSPIN